MGREGLQQSVDYGLLNGCKSLKAGFNHMILMIASDRIQADSREVALTRITQLRGETR